MKQKNSATIEKPKFPDVPPTIEIGPLTFRLLHDFERYSNGSMLMTFADCVVTVSQDGKRIGEAGAALHGTIFATIGDRMWALSARDLFLAAQRADAEQYPAKKGT